MALDTLLTRLRVRGHLLPNSVSIAVVDRVLEALLVPRNVQGAPQPLSLSDVEIGRDGTIFVSDVSCGAPELYVLGLALYEMLTGRDSNQTPNLVGVRLPAGLLPFLTRTVHKDPAQRFQDVREMKAALDVASKSCLRPSPSDMVRVLAESFEDDAIVEPELETGTEVEAGTELVRADNTLIAPRQASRVSVTRAPIPTAQAGSKNDARLWALAIAAGVALSYVVAPSEQHLRDMLEAFTLFFSRSS